MGYGFYILNHFVPRAGSMSQGGNFVVRRSSLEKIGDDNPCFTFNGEDSDLARRLTEVAAVKFTFRLSALSSGRRLPEVGLLRIGIRYSVNVAWATSLHRPFTDDLIDVRH
jgi:hypothetical protein